MIITENDIKKILNFQYHPDNAETDEDFYTGIDILNLCKGNVIYCLSLIERLDWQYPETLIEDDISNDELILIDQQYILTNLEEQ